MSQLSRHSIPPPREWQQFESLCHRLWRSILQDSNTAKNGRQGQPQHGVDVFGKRHASQWVGIQCKGKDHFTKRELKLNELKLEAKKAELFEPRLSEFIIATTAPRDAKLQTEARKLSDENTCNGLFSITVWSWEDILEALDDHSDVAKWYWPAYFSSAEAYRDRATRLELMLKASYGRQIARWQTAGLSREEASGYAADDNLGIAQPGMLPTAIEPLKVLIAPIGSGKSLVAERFLQAAIRGAQSDSTRPIPVYLDLNTQEINSLGNSIVAASLEIGDPQVVGATVVVEGLDYLKPTHRSALLESSRAIVNSWPCTTILLMSRPTLQWNDIEEAVEIPPLDEVQAAQLVFRVAGFNTGPVQGWHQTIRTAIERPLFAILLGRFMRDKIGNPRSVGAMISHVIESVVAAMPLRDETLNAFKRIAVDCLKRKGGVPITEVPSTLRSDILNSGLVVSSNGVMVFAHSIMCIWFAARAFDDGLLQASELLDQEEYIDNWRSAITVAVATSPSDRVTAILAPIAERDIGLLAELVNEGIDGVTMDQGIPSPPAIEAGFSLRNAMETCVSGLGGLATLIAPIREDGRVMPLATRTDGEHLYAAWYNADTERDVVDLPRQIDFASIGTLVSQIAILNGGHDIVPYIRQLRSARPGGHSAWAWRWATDILREKLTKRIQGYSLPIDQGPLMREIAWDSALDLLHLNRFDTHEIEIEAILRVLPMPFHELLGRHTTLRLNHRDISLTELAILIKEHREVGKAVISSPLPLPDRYLKGRSHVWDWYSDDQLINRITAVIRESIQAYCDLVSAWFQPFRSRLNLATTLPAHVEGVVERNCNMDPVMLISFDAVPLYDEIEVCFRYGKVEENRSDYSLSQAFQRLQNLRPVAPHSLYASISIERTYDLLSQNAVRNTAYRWLECDLRHIQWLS